MFPKRVPLQPTSSLFLMTNVSKVGITRFTARANRPVMMTIAGSVIGLLPVMLSNGTGSEIMRRIAAPMVGGMVSATILTLIIFPAVYAVVKEIPLRRSNA